MTTINIIIVGLAFASVCVAVALAWAYNAHRRVKALLINELTSLDQERALTFARWNSWVFGGDPQADKVRAAHASLSAARLAASEDWSWSASTQLVRTMEWRFERAMDNWLYATKNPSLNARWVDEQKIWNARRQQSNGVVGQYNRLLLHPLVYVLACCHQWLLSPEWISESQHRRQLSLNPEI